MVLDSLAFFTKVAADQGTDIAGTTDRGAGSAPETGMKGHGFLGLNSATTTALSAYLVNEPLLIIRSSLWCYT